MNVSCTSQNPPDWPCLHHNPVPWCAPGTAAIKSPCGIFSGGWEHNGRDMLDLDDTPTTVWVAGDVANISVCLLHMPHHVFFMTCPRGSTCVDSPSTPNSTT